LQRGDRLGDLRHPVGVVVTSPGEHPYPIAVANLIGAGLVGDLEQLLEQAISALSLARAYMSEKSSRCRIAS